MAITSLFSQLSYVGSLGILVVLLVTAVVYYVAFVYYPLAKFPGPIRAAISPDWVMRRWLSGRYAHSMKELHDRYGPVVRVSPNQLSFSSAEAWKDIYGHTTGRKPFFKGTFYEPMPGEVSNLLSSRDPVMHSMMRRNLSHGFSTAALSQQEDLIQEYVDLFIQQIGDEKNGSVLEMTSWFNFLTFDIIGKLAFGDPFGTLETGKPHFWIQTIFGGVKAVTFLRVFEYCPPIRSLFRNMYKYKILSPKITEPRRKQVGYAEEKIKRRLQIEPERVDFLTKMIADREKNETSLKEFRSQADMMVVAGSETTATTLSGVTYYLGRTPHSYAKLSEEVRSAFQSYEAINGRSTESLPYLKAVIEEGLRIFPPVPIGLPRVSPGEFVDGHFVPQGTIVFVSSWAATHSEANFHNPFDFIPERWLDKATKDHLAASQPFSLGNRVCLGRNLAYLELRIILAKIFFTYDFKLMDDTLDWVEDNRSFVFWEKPALKVAFTRRVS